VTDPSARRTRLLDRDELPRWTWLVPFALALALLTIGITRDWCLLHEDNGALHTTFARGHLDLGLARTFGQDVFYRPATGELLFYGHHPSGPSLALAAAFTLAGSDAPWVARSVAIAFHLTSLGIFVLLLRHHLAPSLALLGGVVFAILPMSAFFGRMVNYEALCLTGVLLQLYGYARWRSDLPGPRGFALLVLGIVVSGLADWPAFFFAAALGGVELLRGLRGVRDGGSGLCGEHGGGNGPCGEHGGVRRFVAIGVAASVVCALDLLHLVVAMGSLQALGEVIGGHQESVTVTVGAFLEREATHGRRFFGRGAMLASGVLLVALLTARAPLGAELRRARHAEVLASWLGASFAAALAYALAAPSWAMVHAYWSFYFLPFVATAVVLAVAALVRRIEAPGRARMIAAVALLALGLDVVLTSALTLAKRHRTPEDYAVRVTGELRTEYLPPRSYDAATEGASGSPAAR
jgi:hypothetical protein